MCEKEVITYKDVSITLSREYDAENPRERGNLGKMVCFHPTWVLGDANTGIDMDDYSGWDSMLKGLLKDNPNAVILPVYLYDHSGISVSTTPFSCRWDSGQCGWIYATPQGIRKVLGINRVTRKRREEAEELLRAEVWIYNKYLCGDVWTYEFEIGADWYGTEYGRTAALNRAQELIDEIKGVKK